MILGGSSENFERWKVFTAVLAIFFCSKERENVSDLNKLRDILFWAMPRNAPADLGEKEGRRIEPVWPNGRVFDSRQRDPGSNLARANWYFH